VIADTVYTDPRLQYYLVRRLCRQYRGTVLLSNRPSSQVRPRHRLPTCVQLPRICPLLLLPSSLHLGEQQKAREGKQFSEPDLNATAFQDLTDKQNIKWVRVVSIGILADPQ